MNATDFFTRRIMGMDYRVWIAMLLVCISSLGLYGYKQARLNSINRPSCPSDVVIVNGKSTEVITGCYLNRYSIFEVQSETAAKVEWNFRDGTERAKGKIVSHKFEEEGTYRVTVTVNEYCHTDFEVEVTDNPLFSAIQEKPVIEVYADPMRPAIGKTVHFYCVADVPNITSYRWKLLSTNEVQVNPVPAFTFSKEGSYTIQLVINDDPSTLTTNVINVTSEMQQPPETSGDIASGGGIPGGIGPLGNLVAPGGSPSNHNTGLPFNNDTANTTGTAKPPADTSKNAAGHKAPEVDPNAFKDLLQNVVNEGGKELEDLYEYLDYKASTMVEVNESGSLIPLKEFCKNMRGKKKNKRKITSLSFKIDDKKSIQSIRVKVPESGGFWDKVNPFN